MTTLISDHKSLAELYSELLIKQREIQVQLDSGKATCSWCGRRKSEHLPDKRCSVSCLSQVFTAMRRGDMDSINKALGLIEELREL